MINIFSSVKKELQEAKLQFSPHTYTYTYTYNLINYFWDKSQTNMQPSALPRPSCNKGNQHDQQPIIMICLNKQCQAKRLCCLICIDQLHQKHQLVSIKKFESMIVQNVFYNTNNSQKTNIIQALKKYQQEINQKLNSINKQFQQHLGQVSKDLNSRFQQMFQTFELGQWNQDKKIDLYENITNQKVNNYYLMIENMEFQRFSTAQQTQIKIQQFNKNFEKAIIQTNKYVKNGFDYLKKFSDKMKLGSNVHNKFTFHRFSNQYKASGLVLSEDATQVQKQPNNDENIFSAGGYPICLLQQPLSEGNDNASFQLLQQPANQGCWLGIACLEIVKQNNYKNCYGLGKGTYAIDQVGINHSSAYSWSHHDIQHNSTPKVGWTFGVGDVVNVKIDFLNSKAIFSKGVQTYQQPIKLDIGTFYAFAGPTNNSDKFRVLNN